MTGVLECSIDDGVAVITMDDGKANALSPAMLAALGSALDEAERSAGAVALLGRAGRFSAGFDLRTMEAGGTAARDMVARGASLLAELLEFPLPVVAGCDGHALAAGALLLLACDHRIGAEGDFKIGLNEVAIGMALPTFVVELARYRMPPSAFDAILLGEVGDPHRALASGFLDRVVASGDVRHLTVDTARRFAQLPRDAVSRSKSLARRSTIDALRRSAAADGEAMASPAV